MLSTSDNPFNPFTNYDEWLDWDESHGYFTNNYLARMTNFDDDTPDELMDSLIDDAIDEILEANVLGIYIFVPNPDSKG